MCSDARLRTCSHGRRHKRNHSDARRPLCRPATADDRQRRRELTHVRTGRHARHSRACGCGVCRRQQPPSRTCQRHSVAQDIIGLCAATSWLHRRQRDLRQGQGDGGRTDGLCRLCRRLQDRGRQHRAGARHAPHRDQMPHNARTGGNGEDRHRQQQGRTADRGRRQQAQVHAARRAARQTLQQRKPLGKRTLSADRLHQHH